MKLSSILLSLIVAVLVSAPFQMLISRIISDSLYLKTFLPIPGVTLLSTIFCTICSIIFYNKLSQLFNVKISLITAISTPIITLAYVFTSACSAISINDIKLIIHRVTLPWGIFVISFMVSLTVMKVDQSYLIASTTLMVAELLSFVSVIKNVDKINKTFMLIRENLLVKSLKIAVAAFADYSLMMISSIMYYLTIFFDKFLIWSKYGLPYYPLDFPSFVGMVPLFAGTLAAMEFWDSVKDKLDQLYYANLNEIRKIKKFVIKEYLKGLIYTLATAGLVTILIVLLLKINIPSADVLTIYLIGSLPGAVLVYVHPQLLTFRKDLEALLATSAVPTTELLVWKYFGEGSLPMGYFMGAVLAAGLSLIFSIRMYWRIGREAYRVVAYNAFVSYVTEIPRRWG
ncbi:exopolysaccharide Pel transporter PelG [Methanopyrus sp.]